MPSGFPAGVVSFFSSRRFSWEFYFFSGSGSFSPVRNAIGIVTTGLGTWSATNSKRTGDPLRDVSESCCQEVTLTRKSNSCVRPIPCTGRRRVPTAGKREANYPLVKGLD